MGISNDRLQYLIDDAEGRKSLQYCRGISERWFQDVKALLEELMGKRGEANDNAGQARAD